MPDDRTRSTHRLRTTLLAAGALTSTLLVRKALRRRAVLAAVADDLRSPVLYALPSVRDERSLRIGRSVISRAATRVEPEVELSTELAPNANGPDVRVLVYQRPGRARPSGALLWIHGGGTIFGRPEQDNALCSAIAAELDVVVCSVDYRLAPEHPFPAGLDDCMAALQWVHDRSATLGVDTDHVVVGGASAGGLLAAAVAQRARDEGGPAICFQLLVYPMLDDRTVLRSHPGEAVHTWTPASNEFAWTAYLGHAPNAADERPHAVPAREEKLVGLPPAWIGVGDLDLFFDEDVDYAHRLQAAGVDCELHIVPGMYHGADAVKPGSPTTKAFLRSRIDALRAALAS